MWMLLAVLIRCDSNHIFDVPGYLPVYLFFEKMKHASCTGKILKLDTHVPAKAKTQFENNQLTSVSTLHPTTKTYSDREESLHKASATKKETEISHDAIIHDRPSDGAPFIDDRWICDCPKTAKLQLQWTLDATQSILVVIAIRRLCVTRIDVIRRSSGG